MDEIEFKENITLILEDLSAVNSEKTKAIVARIVACMEFMQEQITELQEGVEEIE